MQFRLKQIVSAEADAKEVLLKELEEFAFRGIPDYHQTMRSVEGLEPGFKEEVEPVLSILQSISRQIFMCNC